MIIKVEFSKVVESESLRAEVYDVMQDVIDCAQKATEEGNIEDWAEWIVDIVEVLRRFQDTFDPHTKISVDLDPVAQI